MREQNETCHRHLGLLTRLHQGLWDALGDCPVGPGQGAGVLVLGGWGRPAEHQLGGTEEPWMCKLEHHRSLLQNDS